MEIEKCNLTAIVDISLGDGLRLPAAIMEDVFSGVAEGSKWGIVNSLCGLILLYHHL